MTAGHEAPEIIPVTRLKGVGASVAEKLNKLGIFSVQDVLFHLPYRYEDRTRVAAIGSLQHGDAISIKGRIDYVDVAFSRRGHSRRMLLCHVSDGTGSLLLRFFHFNKQQQEALQPGRFIRCFGEARVGTNTLEMVHPEYRLSDTETGDVVEETLTPVYPAGDGVQQTLLRRLTQQALNLLQQKNILPDYLPEYLHAFSLNDALQTVHRPPADADVDLLMTGMHPAQQRLAFEELLAQHLGLQLLRKQTRQHSAWPLNAENVLYKKFIHSLPYALTAAQQRVADVLRDDLASQQPMMRLVQGDVGCGKTVVAALACIRAIESGFQAAIMAPTEILAEQHFQTFQKWFAPLGIDVAWLSGKLKGKKREQMLARIASGEAAITVGTHALFQDDVLFNQLALVVIDEQHRFGVHQRLALRQKGACEGRVPHQLIMTATPIPRSLAMTAYADLDYSVIDELPPGRTPVTTVVIAEQRREEIIGRVRNACASGRQAYWVCTLIEESEVLQCRAAEDTAGLLTEVLPELRVGLVHGRMKSGDKEKVMAQFKQGETDLLVATTVIEVGVDVPNATLMIIENAERLGLAQLHQLRGRVGRGASASHCVLMYRAPLSQLAQSRLAVMRETSSGF
ncbi:MAG: ATP-dependent helicase RecG, partial [Pseudomonadota bacterium]|nr:ATP-dependent helicase RecG [Pseudomonadota bacterium]